jgi:hypothetical protein
LTDGENPSDDLTAAERRLSEYLEVLRASPPTAAPELISRIVRRARWQHSIREPLVFVGAVAVAINEALSLLSGPSTGDR